MHMNSALCALSDSGIWFKKGKEFGLHRGSRLAKATPELRPPHDLLISWPTGTGHATARKRET